MASKYNDPKWIGQKFGRLTVVEPIRKCANGRSTQWFWKVKCDCGTEKIVRPREIVVGKTVSCSCYRFTEKPCPTKTHGESHTRLHNIWMGMLKRCDPKKRDSERYGKRSISVCEEWKDYIAFASWARSHGYNDELTIERINVNGNYEPSNCTWILMEKQARNRRTTHWVEYKGRRMSLAEASELAGLPYKEVFYRIVHGKWNVDEALSVPLGGANKGKLSEKTCRYCGKTFIGYANQKYCNHICWNDWRNMQRRNERKKQSK